MKKAQTIIAAMSGGVDSVVMLHDFMKNGQKPIVAHFDHGIRPDSTADARFVEALAKKHGLKFEPGSAKLGPKASEDKARRARHGFFQKLLKKYPGAKIATAHHRDDQIETAIINVLRGTNRRGLSSLGDTPDYTRPLLGRTKSEIYDRAAKYRLEWVEDQTNLSPKYLRNRVRFRLVPRMKKDGTYGDFCRLVDWFYRHNPEIDDLVEKLTRRSCEITPRQSAIPVDLLKGNIGAEVLNYVLKRAGASEIDAPEIARALKFAQSARPGRHFNQFPPLVLTKTGDWLLVANSRPDSV